MAEFVGPAIEVGKCVAGPIKRQLNYLCCFNTNIQNLRNESTKLDGAKVGVQRKVDAARRNNEEIVSLETWLDGVNEIQAEMTAIEPEIRNVKSGCLAIKSRFSLSSKATKMAEKMKKLQEDRGKLGEISLPAPSPSITSNPRGQIYEHQSRKYVEEDIMAMLREKKERMMGIGGMGGVGKTTMSKKIMSRAREEGLFDEIVMAVVSQPVDMLRIQKEMAELLGLELKVEGVFSRAHQLRTRLMNSTKSILIILDDLWKRLDLVELGIPDQRDLKDCTILLTSRNTDVFCAMNVEKTFQMKTLEAEEAWSVFKEKVGARVDDPSLCPTAQQIVGECKGLPLALVTVGVALKDKTHNCIWKDALNDLRRGNPQDIPYFLVEVYNPLKLSYDLLESENAKSIFLMCCLFPEDYDICISDLGLYALGLHMFEGITSLEDARNKVQTLVEMLKSHSLLVDSRDDGFTKMHDVVRDVGIFIGAEKGFIDRNLNRRTEESNYNVTWISLFHQQRTDKVTLPGGSVFPNLRFFLTQGPPVWDVKAELTLCDNFLESVGKLHVLSISNYKFRPLPPTIQLLKNIRTLIFYGCELEDISAVGKLTSLEILYCHFCDSIKELPVEIGRLNKLKLLHIDGCQSLSRIAAGVISSLTTLRELTLIRSFSNWEWWGSEGKNAALCEINSLSNLTTLKIQIQDASLANEQIHLSSNLVEFYVGIGKRDGRIHIGRRDMSLQLEKEVIIGDWIHQLLRTTERLYLKGEGSSKLLPFLPECQRLKWLNVQDSNLTRSSGTTTAFPFLKGISVVGELTSLEILYCAGCDSIKELPVEIGRLNKLKLLHISSCYNLTRITAGVISSLTTLEELTLMWSFRKWEWGGSEGKNAALCEINSLSNLTTLNIQIEDASLANEQIHLSSNLVKFYVEIGGRVQFRWGHGRISGGFGTEMSLRLEKEVIIGDWIHQLLRTTECLYLQGQGSSKLLPFLPECQRLKCLHVHDLKLTRSSDGRSNGTTAFPLLEILELSNVDINNLEEIHKGPISLESFNCSSLRSLFPWAMGNNYLLRLKSLTIKHCPMLEQVMFWDIGQNSRDRRPIIFPKLEELRLSNLPRLTNLCKGIDNIEFPALIRIKIKKCPNMKSLVSGAIEDHDDDDSLHLICKSKASFDRLEYLIMDGYDSISSLWCDKIPMVFFTRLVDLIVHNCGDIKSLFSPSIAVNLVNLRELRIESCREMVKVIEGEDVERSLFIKLEVLELKKLPKLKAFCDWKCSLQLPSLEELYISKCPEMERFSFGSLTTPNLKLFIEFPVLTRMEIKNCPNLKSLVSVAIEDHYNDDSLHLICKTEVAFNSLEYLIIDGYDSISSLWCVQIPIDFFTRLVDLTVCNCGDIKSLFLPSIAGNLVNLRKLSITRCSEMVKVIEDEEVERSPFIKLETLYLKTLPKLKAFCDWRCALLLPSLSEVVISKCPELERFSFGSLTTPNLKHFSYNGGERITDYTDDLNEALDTVNAVFGDFFDLEILFGSD